MSYVELIVVLSIFAAMSGIAIFNYGGFQDKVDIKNMAADIASKIVEAQRSALAGQWPPVDPTLISSGWKPSYGVHFFEPNIDNKNFIYFVDLDNNNNQYTGDPDCSDECLNIIKISKNNKISALERCSNEDPGSCVSISDSLSITFQRPDSGATFVPDLPATDNYVKITISNDSESVSSYIKIYPSGRMQVD